MKKVVLALIIGLSASLFSFSASADEKIAIVDVMSILKKMPQKDSVAKSLKSEFQGRADKLKQEEEKARAAAQKLQQSGASMSAENRKKEQNIIVGFEKQAEQFSLDYRKREAEEATKLLNRIQDAVKKIAQQDKYTLVLKAESVFFAEKATDITDQVLKQVR